jgi:hypothetical protein
MKFRKKKDMARFPLTKTLETGQKGVYGWINYTEENITPPPIIY